MKRLGALLLALALVGGAVLINRSIHDDDTDAGDTPASGDPYRVVCATEFTAACKSLAKEYAGSATFATEAPGTTADALATGDEPAFDLWLTSEPWPELAAARAEAAGNSAPRLGDPGAPLASTTLSAVANAANAKAIQDRCGGQVTGACLLAGDESVGVAPITYTASLLWFAATLTGWPELTDPGTGDIDADDVFISSFYSTKASSESDRSPITTILLLPKFDVAIGLNATAELAGAAKGAQFTALPFTPPVLARAVAVPADSQTGRDAAKHITRSKTTDAVAATGWSESTPADAELPDPAVLDYLAQKWSSR